MNKQTNPPLYFYLFMGFTIGLFFYFGWCGFMNLQPFTHKTTRAQENTNCEGLQLKGYCCKSQAQFESGDCTK
jgi:hypothetical protein